VVQARFEREKSSRKMGKQGEASSGVRQIGDVHDAVSFLVGVPPLAGFWSRLKPGLQLLSDHLKRPGICGFFAARSPHPRAEAESTGDE
jgi:hypothetical protein